MEPILMKEISRFKSEILKDEAEIKNHKEQLIREIKQLNKEEFFKKMGRRRTLKEKLIKILKTWKKKFSNFNLR